MRPMRFLVTGSDESSGRDTQVVVEADDPGDAERKAIVQGLAVSTVVPDPAVRPDVLPYRTPRQAMPDPAPLASDGPPYKRIVTTAALASGFGMFAIIAGSMCIAWGGFAGLAMADGWLAGIVVGLCLVAAGVLLRLAAASAEALRDLARNSFRK